MQDKNILLPLITVEFFFFATARIVFFKHSAEGKCEFQHAVRFPNSALLMHHMKGQHFERIPPPNSSYCSQ